MARDEIQPQRLFFGHLDECIDVSWRANMRQLATTFGSPIPQNTMRELPVVLSHPLASQNIN
jgi:hypothetical protein